MSEIGLHRPTVAGIHGGGNECAYSVVLSGVYDEDIDEGDTFYYSGCGGKVKDSKRRVIEKQVTDQKLTKQNR